MAETQPPRLNPSQVPQAASQLQREGKILCWRGEAARHKAARTRSLGGFWELGGTQVVCWQHSPSLAPGGAGTGSSCLHVPSLCLNPGSEQSCQLSKGAGCNSESSQTAGRDPGELLLSAFCVPYLIILCLLLARGNPLLAAPCLSAFSSRSSGWGTRRTNTSMPWGSTWTRGWRSSGLSASLNLGWAMTMASEWLGSRGGLSWLKQRGKDLGRELDLLPRQKLTPQGWLWQLACP